MTPAAEVFTSFLDDETDEGAVLTAELQRLFVEGETVDDVVDFVQILENRAVRVPADGLPPVFDICGTGGTGTQRINLSTALAVHLSGDFAIAKHGNRAASGRFGSFDIVEQLAYPACTTPEQVRAELAEKNLAFVFAPVFHPVLGRVAPIRKELGHATIFNNLGPLLNPVANVTAQLVGTRSPAQAELLAAAAAKLGKNILFVHDTAFGLDDVSIGGETMFFKVLNGEVSSGSFIPEDYGLPRIADFAEIQGGSTLAEATQMCRSLIDSNATPAQQNFLELNRRVASAFFKEVLS